MRKTVYDQPKLNKYANCTLTGYDEYWGKWLECECGYKNNTDGAKYCGGCGKLIKVVEENDNQTFHYGNR